MTHAGPEKKETFGSHLPAVIASAVVTVGVTFLASFLGTAGTIGGLALGSMLSGTGSWYGERGIRLAAARARARREAAKIKGAPLTPDQTGVINLKAEYEYSRRHGRSKRLPLAITAAIAATALVAGITVTGLTAAATGKTVTQLVRQQAPAPQSSRRREHSPSLPPSNTPSTPSTSPDATPTSSPTASPDPSPDLAPPSFPGSAVPASSVPASSPAASTGQARPAAAQEPLTVNPGSYCSVAGSTGVTTSGRTEVCRTSSTDSRLRWRKP